MLPAANCPLQNPIGAQQLIGRTSVETSAAFLMLPYWNIVTGRLTSWVVSACERVPAVELMNRPVNVRCGPAPVPPQQPPNASRAPVYTPTRVRTHTNTAPAECSSIVQTRHPCVYKCVA
jgi:hypothetical protein